MDENMDVTNEGQKNATMKSTEKCNNVIDLSPFVNSMNEQRQCFQNAIYEKCKNSLLEISEVDSVLLQELPSLTTKYAETINDIRQQATLLSKRYIKLPLLLKDSKENLRSFKKEKDAGEYEQYAEAANKLEKSISMSISKIPDVLQEIEIVLDFIKQKEYKTIEMMTNVLNIGYKPPQSK